MFHNIARNLMRYRDQRLIICQALSLLKSYRPHNEYKSYNSKKYDFSVIVVTSTYLTSCFYPNKLDFRIQNENHITFLLPNKVYLIRFFTCRYQEH